MTKSASKFKSQVSRHRGMMVRIIKKRFPKRKTDKAETQIPDALKFQAATPPLYPQLRESWMKVDASDISKDIHRLIFRVNVHTSGKEILLSPPPKSERGSNKKTAETVTDLIKLLGTKLLDPEEAQKVEDICNDLLVAVEDKTDLINFNLDLFKAIGEDNKILKVLRCIHQSLVLKPYGILRTVMIKDKITKDVRSEDGWQVVITLSEGYVQVVHLRKEQSVDLPTRGQPISHKNHWEYQWEVSMTFDGQMKDMTQSRLSITNLSLHEEMDPLLEQELRHLMQNGDLIVF